MISFVPKNRFPMGLTGMFVFSEFVRYCSTLPHSRNSGEGKEGMQWCFSFLILDAASVAVGT